MRKAFWLHLVLDPFTALDLTDAKGQPDHGKILPAILLLAAIVAQFLDRQFSAAVLVILGSLSYGYGAWRAFLKSRVVTATEMTMNKTVNVNVKREEILARRDVDLGIDPTYE